MVHVLKDILQEDLKVIFVGSAASNESAAKKHYYANPRNFFWKCLQESDLIDTELSSDQDYCLLRYGFGLTDVVKTEHGSDSKLSKEMFEAGREPLKAKINRFNPEVVCFTSKTAYRAFFEKKARSYGLQEEKIGKSKVFIVPSPSPRVMSERVLDGKNRLHWFKELAKFIKS